MDEDLVTRWRQGDPDAEPAVRNAIRTVSMRLLVHPALRPVERAGGQHMLRDDQQRRELAGEVAAEVMRRGASSAAQLHASALLVAARRALEVVRTGRPSSRDAHVPTSVVVMLAVAPEALPEQAKGAADAHLEHCHQCRDDVRLMDTVVRAEAVADPFSAVDDVAPASAPKRPVAPARPIPAARPKVARRQAQRADASARDDASFPWGFVALLGLGSAAFLVWWFTQQPNEQERVSLAQVADRAPPAVPAPGDLPPDAVDALGDLGRGDCYAAAPRLRTLRKRNPEAAGIARLEAAAWVCRGDALAARDALAAVGVPPASEAGDAWSLAQIALLEGDEDLAREQLLAVAAADPVRAAGARVQLTVLDGLVD
jgi:hypothetical protein